MTKQTISLTRNTLITICIIDLSTILQQDTHINLRIESQIEAIWCLLANRLALGKGVGKHVVQLEAGGTFALHVTC